MARELAKRSITADEYERMGEAGIFESDARLELIEGDIYELPSISSFHAGCVSALAYLLCKLTQYRYIVRVQNPIRLSDLSEPLPDLALLRWRDDFYRHAHPRPADVLLVIEVADTTIATDRAVKLPLYAQTGINEVWLVNLPEEQIELYAALANGVYQTVKHFQRGEDVQAQPLSGLIVGADAVLG